MKLLEGVIGNDDVDDTNDSKIFKERQLKERIISTKEIKSQKMKDAAISIGVYKQCDKIVVMEKKILLHFFKSM